MSQKCIFHLPTPQIYLLGLFHCDSSRKSIFGMRIKIFKVKKKIYRLLKITLVYNTDWKILHVSTY